MMPFLPVTVSLFKQSTGYSVKSNNFFFLVCPIPRGWEEQDDRKAQKNGKCESVNLSKGSGGRCLGLPISVTLSWVHLCQKSSELSAACQASKRFLEKILLHIPRKCDRYNKQCRLKHKFFQNCLLLLPQLFSNFFLFLSKFCISSDICFSGRLQRQTYFRKNFQVFSLSSCFTWNFLFLILYSVFTFLFFSFFLW